MPIKKQNRFLRQYHADLKNLSAKEFIEIVESLRDHKTLKPAVQVNLSLQFEDAVLSGDIGEVRELLDQIDKDESPHAFNSTIATNTNPRRQLSFNVAFGQRLVTFQLQNTARAQAQPLFDIVSKKLPEVEASPTTDASQVATTSEGQKETYLPGAFRPTLIPEVSERDVFVIMSFKREHRDAFNLAISPVLSKLGFKAIRVDQIQHNTTVTPEIVRQIESSAFVVADLTGERPNVYYEVGYAHRADKEVILMARKDTAVHFDVAAINRIEYDDFTDLVEALEKRVRAIADRRGITIPADEIED